MSDRVAELRAKIDEIDAKIAENVRDRRSIVQQMFVEKRAHALPIDDATREAAIAVNYASNVGDIADDKVAALVRAVLDACR